MDFGLIKVIIDVARESGLLPVVLFALLLKVYVINGNLNKHFDAMSLERRLLRRVIRRIDRLICLRTGLDSNESREEGEEK